MDMSHIQDAGEAVPADSQWLIKRGLTWYIRVIVPPSVREALGGKQHILRSLKTRDLTQARKLRIKAKAAIDDEIEAARGNSVKASADHWSKRRADDRFNGSEFIDTTQTIARRHGEEAAAEFSARSFGLHTDLDTRESEWFADAKFEAKTEALYKFTLTLLKAHLKRQVPPLPECVQRQHRIR